VSRLLRWHCRQFTQNLQGATPISTPLELMGFAVPGVNVKERSNSGSRASPTAETGDRVVISTEGPDLFPLDFFLQAMRDPEASLNLHARPGMQGNPRVFLLNRVKIRARGMQWQFYSWRPP